jgi:hypothetical protein
MIILFSSKFYFIYILVTCSWEMRDKAIENNKEKRFIHPNSNYKKKISIFMLIDSSWKMKFNKDDENVEKKID